MSTIRCNSYYERLALATFCRTAWRRKNGHCSIFEKRSTYRQASRSTHIPVKATSSLAHDQGTQTVHATHQDASNPLSDNTKLDKAEAQEPGFGLGLGLCLSLSLDTDIDIGTGMGMSMNIGLNNQKKSEDETEPKATAEVNVTEKKRGRRMKERGYNKGQTLWAVRESERQATCLEVKKKPIHSMDVRNSQNMFVTLESPEKIHIDIREAYCTQPIFAWFPGQQKNPGTRSRTRGKQSIHFQEPAESRYDSFNL